MRRKVSFVATSTLAAAAALSVTVLGGTPASASSMHHHPYKLAGHATNRGDPEFVTIRLRGCKRPPVVHAESADGMTDNFTVTHRVPGRNRYEGPMIFGRYDPSGTWHITTSSCPGWGGRTIRISSPNPRFTVTR